MYIIHIPCIVQELSMYEIESIFLNHAVYLSWKPVTTLQFTHYWWLKFRLDGVFQPDLPYGGCFSQFRTEYCRVCSIVVHCAV